MQLPAAPSRRHSRSQRPNAAKFVRAEGCHANQAVSATAAGRAASRCKGLRQLCATDLSDPASRILALFDIVTKEAPRRARSREAAPHFRRHTLILERARGELDRELLCTLVVARSAEVASTQAFHFHRVSPS